MILTTDVIIQANQGAAWSSNPHEISNIFNIISCYGKWSFQDIPGRCPFGAQQFSPECFPACAWTVVKHSETLQVLGVLPPKPPGLVRFKCSVLRHDVPSAIVGGGQRWLSGKLRVVITPQGGFNMVVVPSCGTTPKLGGLRAPRGKGVGGMPAMWSWKEGRASRFGSLRRVTDGGHMTSKSRRHVTLHMNLPISCHVIVGGAVHILHKVTVGLVPIIFLLSRRMFGSNPKDVMMTRGPTSTEGWSLSQPRDVQIRI